jgi:glycogen debranching enzyme
MSGRPLEGFFEADTQLVTRYEWRINGVVPQCTFSAQTAANQWIGVFYLPGSMEEGDLPEGTLPRGSIEMRVRRAINGAWRESIDIRRHGSKSQRVELSLRLACPIGDVGWHEEMKRTSPARSGVAPDRNLRFERRFGKNRRGREIVRALSLAFKSNAPVRVHRGRITTLSSRADRILRLELRFQPEIDGTRSRPFHPIADVKARIRSGHAQTNLMLAQCADDLDALQLPAWGKSDGPVSVAAGVPRYIGFFCRDILTTAWQSSLLTIQPLIRSLHHVSTFRGQKWDARRDEEPDRIAHELRMGPLAALGKTNRDAYFGDVASTPFWIFALANAFHWTGDSELVKQHAPTLEGCCRWIERRLEAGRGFIYYAPASAEGNRHHAWKDSGDAIVDARGRIRIPPLAACEIQGYAYLALLAAAELSLALQRFRRARDFFRQASDLKRRFNRAFWMPEHSFFAVALDADGRPIDSIASNIGHGLGCGIIDADKVPSVVARLMSRDLFSPWGIRTLSTDNPAYDPFSYHRGSVWPVENATIAGGMRLWGYDEQAARIIGALFQAAEHFPNFRLPEVMSGHDSPIPGLYPNSNLLQAWSVSSIPFSIQVLLGLRPYAQLQVLLVKPHLPDWLPWIEVRDLRVGRARVSLRFERDRWTVLEKKGRLLVLEQSGELDPEISIWKRIREAL